MQFLVSVLDDKTNSATPEEMSAITAFNERIIADGNWVFAGAERGHRRRQPRRRRDLHGRALSGVEGVRRRPVDHGGRRPRRRP